MITVYGKANCPKCDAAKMKLALMGLRFAFVDLAQVGVFREHPRAVDAQVESVLRKDDVPLFLIDERWYDYPEAMRFLKDRMGGGSTDA
jgi:glutaredoxin